MLERMIGCCNHWQNTYLIHYTFSLSTTYTNQLWTLHFLAKYDVCCIILHVLPEDESLLYYVSSWQITTALINVRGNSNSKLIVAFLMKFVLQGYCTITAVHSNFFLHTHLPTQTYSDVYTKTAFHCIWYECILLINTDGCRQTPHRRCQR